MTLKPTVLSQKVKLPTKLGVFFKVELRLDWGSFSSPLLKSTSFSEAHFEIHKNEAQTN